MIKSLLIANRGEIARRIIRTARRLDIRTVAVYSSADAVAPHVREADAAVCIGAPPARESYLDAAKILAAARESGAAAIHPGYGFLSENAAFAEAVQAAGLVWVGAPPAAIRAMGMKDAAKALMIEAGVPVTPGYLGEDQTPARLKSAAVESGFPVLIKAVAGGGGKGMRRVDDAAAFDDALASCRREALASFGDDRVLIEKYVLSPRHIEVQVFGDTLGEVVHLFERDCSLQRRHQKVIEEAPAPGMDALTREWLCSTAVRAARAVDYVGAGTIEFIADASAGLQVGRIWFMEMNTRLQVEHPVTEAVTGQDLVEWQLRVASGEALPRRQAELALNGHAMEARLYAENPTTGFLPSTGQLRRLRFPTDIRIDSGVEEGGEITGFYDPMIAKLIVHAASRTGAARQLANACRAVEAWPVKTNAAFLARVADDADFVAARLDTGFIERKSATLIPAATPGDPVLQAAARALSSHGSVSGSGSGGGGAAAAGPWSRLTGFRSGAAPYRKVTVAINDASYPVTVNDGASPISAASAWPATVVTIDGERVLFSRGEAWSFGIPTSERVGGAGAVSDGMLRSPMPGRIIHVAVVDGQKVSKGQTLLVLEAMKMEHAMTAPFDGTVAALKVKTGDQVAENLTLVRVVVEA